MININGIMAVEKVTVVSQPTAYKIQGNTVVPFYLLICLLDVADIAIEYCCIEKEISLPFVSHNTHISLFLVMAKYNKYQV